MIRERGIRSTSGKIEFAKKQSPNNRCIREDAILLMFLAQQKRSDCNLSCGGRVWRFQAITTFSADQVFF